MERGVTDNNMYHQLTKEQRKKLKNLKLTDEQLKECHDCKTCEDILQHLEICKNNNG